MPALQGAIEEEYIRETHNLAKRANRKYEQAREASAFFVLGLQVLAVALVVSIWALAHGGAAQVELDWTLKLRIEVSLVTSAAVLVIVYFRTYEVDGGGWSVCSSDIRRRCSL
jgi:hypothetical protein